VSCQTPPPEVWLYEGESGGFYINNIEGSEVLFHTDKERENWLSFFPDVIRHQGKPSIEKWWQQP